MPRNTKKPPSKLAESLSDALKKELKEISDFNLENKESILKLCKKVLAETDGVDEEICQALDFLQCQVEHNQNQKIVKELLRHRASFGEEFSDVRYLFRELRDSLMENIRYGKRTREVDELLTRLTTLMTIAKQAPVAQPSINFTGLEHALKPRCADCQAPCMSSFRKTQTFVRKLVRAVELGGEKKAKPKKKPTKKTSRSKKAG